MHGRTDVRCALGLGSKGPVGHRPWMFLRIRLIAPVRRGPKRFYGAPSPLKVRPAPDPS
jgi:hypothetical protein